MAPARIEVERIAEGEFRVRVIEGASESLHDVTIRPEDARRITNGKVESEDLIRRSFEFLLERESKESILAKFDLRAIERYFPEYECEIQRKL